MGVVICERLASANFAWTSKAEQSEYPSYKCDFLYSLHLSFSVPPKGSGISWIAQLNSQSQWSFFTTASISMTVRKPHFLLFCDAATKVSQGSQATAMSRSKWRCIVDDLSENDRIEISDTEVDTTPERSSLIAVVRGLEALQQPSQVTLVTSSPYVNKGLRYGLREWRENDYQWEHFGTEKPVRNADLWRRIDQALQYHSLECRLIENALPADENNGVEISSTGNRYLRVDDAHPEFLHKSAAGSALVNPKSNRRKIAILFPLIRSCYTVLSSVLRIPEYTVYAIESIIDSVLSLPQRAVGYLMAAMPYQRHWSSRSTTY